MLTAKFLLGPKGKPRGSYIISEDESAVEEWTSPRTEDDKAQIDRQEDEDSFVALTADYVKSMDKFFKLINVTMGIAPIGIQIEFQQLYDYIKNNGIEIRKDENYIYFRLPLSHIGKIDKMADGIKAMRAGIDSLPGMLLLGLVSSYDEFFGRLIRLIYNTKPEMLSSSEKNISFKELSQLGSVQAARDMILEKEVETVLRNSHHQQIDWLEGKLGMTLTDGLDIWSEFIEIFERRNLFTHTDGVVSSQYMEVCSAHKAKVDCKNGDRLEVDRAYLRRSIYVLSEFGLKLIRVVWRKLIPKEIDAAAIELNQVGYELIINRRYRLARTMLDFGLNVMKKHGEDRTRKMMIVNLANSMRLSGDLEAAKKILDAEDWSSTGADFKICVEAVKEDVDEVIALIKTAAAIDPETKDNLREWPVFRGMEKNARFIEEFERVFGEPFVSDKKTIETKQLEMPTVPDEAPVS
jgi:hypothetical protein